MFGFVGTLGLGFGVEFETDGELQDERDDCGDNRRVGEHCERTDDLAPELVDAAAEEQTVHTGVGVGDRDEPDQDGADKATDEVDTDDVE